MAQALDFIAAGFLDLHIFPAVFQLFDGLLQPADRVGDICGNAEVEESHQEDKEEQQGQAKQEQFRDIRILPRHYAYELPSGVAYGLDRDLATLVLKFFCTAAVRIGGCRQIVLLQKAGVDQLLSRMVNQLPVPIDDIQIAAA